MPPATQEQFGRVIPNNSPSRTEKWTLEGKAREFWYKWRDAHGFAGRAPTFHSTVIAERALRRLYLAFGHTVTPEECRVVYEIQAAHRERWELSLARWDAIGRARRRVTNW